jgi:hypothetical protein
METPYTQQKEQLDSLIQEGEEIKEILIKAKESRGKISAAEAFGKWAFQEHSRTISTLGRAFRSDTKVSEYRVDAIVGQFLIVLRDLIDDLQTGRRKSELKVKKKREFLKKLGIASQKKSVMARLNAFLRLSTEISTELTALDIIWKPRTKLIPSGRPLKGRVEVEQIFSTEVSEFLWVCDPYFSHETLAMLEATPIDIPITVLTAKIQDIDVFNKSLTLMRNKGRRIDVYLLKGGPRNAPHDRYIVDGKKAWNIGTSIKDIGNRDSTISHIDNRMEIIQMMEEYISGANGHVIDL